MRLYLGIILALLLFLVAFIATAEGTPEAPTLIEEPDAGPGVGAY
jgi:hypothetical protein